MAKSGQFTLRVPPALHEEMAVIADLMGTSVTALVLEALRQARPRWREELAPVVNGRIRALAEVSEKIGALT